MPKAHIRGPWFWRFEHQSCGRRRSICCGSPGGSGMAQYQTKPAIDTVDPVWARVRREAEEAVRREPELASFIYSTILHHDTLEAAVVIGWQNGSTTRPCRAASFGRP